MRRFLCFSVGREAEGEYVDGACELFSDISISLLGQPLTTQDILAAEIQPYFSAYTEAYAGPTCEAPLLIVHHSA